MKDFNYDCEKAIKLIHVETVVNIIKYVIFNTSYDYRTRKAGI